jgi:hypothetical protein
MEGAKGVFAVRTLEDGSHDSQVCVREGTIIELSEIGNYLSLHSLSMYMYIYAFIYDRG